MQVRRFAFGWVLLLSVWILGGCTSPPATEPVFTSGPTAVPTIVPTIAPMKTPAMAPTAPPAVDLVESPVAPAAERSVVGWLGYVVSLPEGSQFDDYVVFLPEGAGEVGLTGATSQIEEEIVALRDKPEPGKLAHFWGRLTCDVPDYGGCQLLVTHLRYGATYTGPEPIEGWEGTLVGNPPRMQFDDYFVLVGDFAVAYGIHSLNPEIQSQLAGLRDTGIPFHVWGQLRCGVPDAYGAQIEVTHIGRSG